MSPEKASPKGALGWPPGAAGRPLVTCGGYPPGGSAEHSAGWPWTGLGCAAWTG
jgi:hypothetical protein